MFIINVALKFLASGSYAIIYIYANELFPTNVRNTGMGICSMVARIGAIIGTFCNYNFMSSLGTYVSLSKVQFKKDSYIFPKNGFTVTFDSFNRICCLLFLWDNS